MKTLAITLLLLCLSPNLWALDSLGKWAASASFSITDAPSGLLTQSPASDGNLREMKVYLGSLGNGRPVKCAFYLWPDTTLIDSTEIVTPPADTGWVVFKFIDSAAIYADSNYCLLAWADGNENDIKIYYALSGDDWARDLIRTYGVWPAVFNSIDNVNAYPIAIYATYEPSAAATGQVIIIQQ
jgi:hypothetical protein